MVGDAFHQFNRGIVTGGVLATSIANIFMEYVRRDIEENMPAKFKNKLNLFSRFIDDIFSLFHGDQELADEFEEYLIEAYDKFDLEITFRFHTTGLEFLDLWIFKSNNKIETREYRKETANNSYLEGSSNHHHHSVFTGIIKGQMGRLRRLCSLDSDYLESLSHLKTRCYNSNYKKSQVDQLIEIGAGWERNIKTEQEYLNRTSSKNLSKKTIPWVQEFVNCQNSTFNQLRKLAQDLNNKILKPTDYQIKIIPQNQSSTARILFRNNSTKFLNNKCPPKKKKVCFICEDFPEDRLINTVTSESGEVIRISPKCNCRSGGIYVSNCTDCGSKYVGKTVHFHVRLKSHTDENSASALKSHLQICPNSSSNLEKKFKFQFITNMFDRGKYTLSEIERLWISRLQPSINCQKPNKTRITNNNQ